MDLTAIYCEKKESVPSIILPANDTEQTHARCRSSKIPPLRLLFQSDRFRFSLLFILRIQISY